MHTEGEFLSGIASFAILNYFKVDENNIIQNAFKAECAAFLKTDNLCNHDSIGNTVVLHALYVLFCVLYILQSFLFD